MPLTTGQMVAVGFCCMIIVAALLYAVMGSSSSSSSGSMPTGGSLAAFGNTASTSNTTTSNTTTSTAFTLVAGTTSPPYAKAGYHPIPFSNLPAKFTLKNTSTGNYWGQNNDQVTDSPSAATISAVSKSDIYNQTGTGTYTLTLNGDSTKSIRHAGYVMWYNNYTPANYDFTWQLFLRDGTPDQVIVWNPFPGDGTGMHVKADGSRQRIDPGDPTVYTLTPVTSSSTPSSYMTEPFSLF